MTESYWVYILLCNNNTYYTGYTHDLNKRYQSHINGTGKCKYTLSFKPTALIQCWEIKADKAFAMSIERLIKKLSRLEKERVIAHPADLIQDARVVAGSKMLLKELNALCK